MSAGDLTFLYHEVPEEPLLKEGATVGWIIDRRSDGTARAAKVVAIVDGEGNGAIVQDGEWEPVTIVDDSEDGDGR